jgi:ribosomal protein S18 acetylase RimI-like enzyme
MRRRAEQDLQAPQVRRLETVPVDVVTPSSPTHLSLADIGHRVYWSGARNGGALEERLQHMLDLGTTKPQWCWAAVLGGQVVARQVWWCVPGSRVPAGVDLITTTDRRAAWELLQAVRASLGVAEATCELHAPITDPCGPNEQGRMDVRVLEDAGFTFGVARVSVEWTPAAPAHVRRGRLSFQAASEVDEGELIRLFETVAQGSLDHGMIEDRARLGARGEAVTRLGRALGYRAENGWFRVGRDQSGTLAGYVVPGLAGDAPMIAEIGVAVAHRGKGYADDLLIEGIAVLMGVGAARIVADTDLQNTPMRAAFRRCGYREYRWRDDFAWTLPRSG